MMLQLPFGAASYAGLLLIRSRAHFVTAPKLERRLCVLPDPYVSVTAIFSDFEHRRPGVVPLMMRRRALYGFQKPAGGAQLSLKGQAANRVYKVEKRK
jgi:hypothetical protein